MIQSRDTIPSQYIETFLPIHALDEVKSTAPNGIAPVISDDLFLISQVSAYATGDSNAVMVSKKISYKSLSEKISDDFDIAGVKLSIDGLSTNLHTLSIYTHNSVNQLSDHIKLSVQTLSTYTNTICANLCTTIDQNFIKNYTQTCCLLTSTDDLNNSAYLAENIKMRNGRIEVTSSKAISSLIVPDNWRLTTGAAIGGSFIRQTEQYFGGNEWKYTILSDCYFNANMYMYENDTTSPLQVWIEYYDSTDESMQSSLYKVFNNPGGFSGKDIVNNYHFAVPLKSFPNNDSGKKTSIIIKYQNGESIDSNSHIDITEYHYYAVPSKDDLNGYVQKNNLPLPDYDQAEVCKIKFNDDGVITDATSVYYGVATQNLCGLVKLKSDNNEFGHPYYKLRLNNNNEAYVTVNSATSSRYGTVQLFPASTEASKHEHAFGDVHYPSSLKHFLSCALENAASAMTYIPVATNNNFGVVKLSSNHLDYSNSPANPLSSYLGTNSAGQAFVSIPYAHYDDGHAIPGIVKTGMPDTTDFRAVRNVYLNEEGIACVNVVSQIGVGPWHITGTNTGYTKHVEIALTAAAAASSIDDLSTFSGNSTYSADYYGSHIFSKTERVNGWFSAELVYEGHPTSPSTYNDDTFLQIVCDGIVVTTLHPKYIQGAPGKPFMHSTYLGVFRGGPEAGSYRLFAAISNVDEINNGNDKIHFLIKEANIN